MVGTKYYEHCGEMTIENVRTGFRCTLNLQQNGYWGPTNVVSGTIYAPGRLVKILVVSKVNGTTKYVKCLTLPISVFYGRWHRFLKTAPHITALQHMG